MQDASFFYEYDSKYFSWEELSKYDNWLYVFDKLPGRMRLIVDFRMSGTKPAEIAKIMSIDVQTVKNQLDKAKDRFLRGAKLI